MSISSITLPRWFSSKRTFYRGIGLAQWGDSETDVSRGMLETGGSIDRSIRLRDSSFDRASLEGKALGRGTKIGNRNFLVEKYTAASSGAQPARLHANPVGSQPRSTSRSRIIRFSSFLNLRLYDTTSLRSHGCN